MAPKQDMELWLDISRALFNSLMPKDLKAEMAELLPSEHIAIVDRQVAKVNQALVSMALADSEDVVQKIFAGLVRETIIALCSRWALYHKEWQTLSSAKGTLWVPPDQKDLWRTIFLAMTDDTEAASAARKRLWPEQFGEPLG